MIGADQHFPFRHSIEHIIPVKIGGNIGIWRWVYFFIFQIQPTDPCILNRCCGHPNIAVAVLYHPFYPSGGDALRVIVVPNKRTQKRPGIVFEQSHRFGAYPKVAEIIKGQWISLVAYKPVGRFRIENFILRFFSVVMNQSLHGGDPDILLFIDQNIRIHPENMPRKRQIHFPFFQLVCRRYIRIEIVICRYQP